MRAHGSKSAASAFPPNQKMAKGAGTGQAPAISRQLWDSWLSHIKCTAGPRTYFLIWCTGAFALRCSEACQLQREHINDGASLPFIRIHGGEKPGKSFGASATQGYSKENPAQRHQSHACSRSQTWTTNCEGSLCCSKNWVHFWIEVRFQIVSFGV